MEKWMKERLQFVIGQLSEILDVESEFIMYTNLYTKLVGIKGVLIELLSLPINDNTVIELRNRIAVLVSDLDATKRTIQHQYNEIVQLREQYTKVDDERERQHKLNVDLNRENEILFQELCKKDKELLKSVLQYYNTADVLDVVSVMLKEKK